ncbi:unnamed protein product [Prunus brigantina]
MLIFSILMGSHTRHHTKSSRSFENQIKNFPYPYSSTALASLMASIQSVIFALCVERDWKQWKLVLMASYSGILISGLALILMTWGVKKEGQFFASVFQPVLLVMVALAGSFLLDEKLHMGSILGGLLIVVGLYAILWASSKDKSIILNPQQRRRCQFTQVLHMLK